MITLTINAHDGKEFISALALVGVRAAIAELDTEALINELRGRMAQRGLAVNIESPDQTVHETNGTGGEPAPATRARRGPRAAAQPTAAPAAGTGGPAPEAPSPSPPPPPPPHPPATQAGPTRDDVIRALNDYSEPRGGQVAGRQKMQEICGVTRLQDIAPADYGKLIVALRQ